MSVSSLCPSVDKMVVSEELNELMEWESAKNELKKRIKVLSETTFEIYGLHYFMWEFPQKYSHYLKLSMSVPRLDIERVRRQFYGPFKKLELVARDIQRNLKNFSFLQGKLNELANRDEVDPLMSEMNHLSSNALRSVKLFNLHRHPLRGTTVGIKRRSPILLDEETRIVRQKIEDAKLHCVPVLMDEEAKTSRV